MKRDILLAGVGGQGAISIAAAIAEAALRAGLHIKQAETHGMSQRGGAVVSHLRYADHPVHSDLIEHGSADLIIAVEPMEGIRYLDYLREGGIIITSTTPVLNIDNYPDMDEVLGKVREIEGHIMFDAERLAKAAATGKAANMVLLGAASPLLGLGKDEDWFALLEDMWKAKGDKVVKANQNAYAFGRDAARLYKQCIDGGIDPKHALTLANHIHPESDIEVHVTAWAKTLMTAEGSDLLQGLAKKRELVSQLPDELARELEPTS